jgi:putative ABC transport system ATP-binding protein
MSKNEHPRDLIRLRHLTRVFPLQSGEVRAVDDVSIDLPGGAFVAIVGRSGSGKSTLVNLIAGLDRSTSGEIEVATTKVHALDEDALASWRGRTVGVVFQFFQLLPTLTIAENVALPMDFCGTHTPVDARARALSLLDQVGIREQADKLPSELSGGQQQRAAIARALANDPQVIVADEPTGNLDAQTAERILDMLAELAHEGRTVLMVTHDRDVASRVDMVVSLADGKVVASTRAAPGAIHA